MDKVKEQAAVAKEVAKSTADKGQAAIDAAQAKSAADKVLRQLGLQILLERTGRGTATTEGAIEDSIKLLTEYEAEHGAFSDPGAEPEASS